MRCCSGLPENKAHRLIVIRGKNEKRRREHILEQFNVQKDDRTWLQLIFGSVGDSRWPKWGEGRMDVPTKADSRLVRQ